MVVKIVCALKVGGDFTIEHVQWLARQVRGLVCVTEETIPGVETIKPVMDLPGWWIKMNAFAPDVFEGDMLLIDLDTVVLRLPAMPSDTTVLNDWNNPDGIGSGFMYVSAKDRTKVWNAFKDAPSDHMRRHRAAGDQGFIRECLPLAHRWGDNVRSYKLHCRSHLPKGTDVVCFHGQPRPWAVKEHWVPKMSNEPQMTDQKAVTTDFRELILKHKGKRFCVMGSGPSLEDDLKLITADIYISANGRGSEFKTPDYVLAMDEVHKTSRICMGEHIRTLCSAPIISPHGYADIRLGDWPQNPRWVLSGMVAVWAAFVMGAKVVHLAGLDAYGGDPGFMDEAMKIARDVKCPVRVVDGPLLKVWEKLDPSEKFPKYEPHEAINRWLQKDGCIKVKVLKSCPVNGVQAKPGEILQAWRHDVWRLIKHRMVEEA
jgi:hypothetical protein